MEKEEYAQVVARYRNIESFTPDQLVGLADDMGAMSEEIYEHYRAMQDLCKRELGKIRDAYEREGSLEALYDREQREKIWYVLKKAGEHRAILWEKYEKMERQERALCKKEV